VLEVLSLIDWALVGGLLGMRMRSGYERFLSRLDAAVEDGVRRGWLDKTDDTKLNKTLPWSLGALCSIHLLQIGMNASSRPKDQGIGYASTSISWPRRSAWVCSTSSPNSPTEAVLDWRPR
jgi:uncharacterized protein (TIGR00645 family)